LRKLRKLHSTGHHADNGCRQPVDANGPSENRTIAGVAIHPQAIAQDNDRGRAAAIVFWQKVSAQQWGLANGRKCVRTHVRAHDAFGHMVIVRDVEAQLTAIRRESGECPSASLQIQKVSERASALLVADIDGADGEQPLGTLERKIPQQHAVHDATDEVVRRDTKCEGKHDGDRERGLASHGP
jgi:hypothetical protein